MTKRTFQPKKRRKIRIHGFRKLMKSPGGRARLKRRRAKGRNQLAANLGTGTAKNKRISRKR